MDKPDAPKPSAPPKPPRLPEHCSVCGALGSLAPTNTTTPGVLCVEYRCADGHAWTVEYPR